MYNLLNLVNHQQVVLNKLLLQTLFEANFIQ